MRAPERHTQPGLGQNRTEMYHPPRPGAPSICKTVSRSLRGVFAHNGPPNVPLQQLRQEALESYIGGGEFPRAEAAGAAQIMHMHVNHFAARVAPGEAGAACYFDDQENPGEEEIPLATAKPETQVQHEG